MISRNYLKPKVYTLNKNNNLAEPIFNRYLFSQMNYLGFLSLVFKAVPVSPKAENMVFQQSITNIQGQLKILQEKDSLVAPVTVVNQQYLYQIIYQQVIMGHHFYSINRNYYLFRDTRLMNAPGFQQSRFEADPVRRDALTPAIGMPITMFQLVQLYWNIFKAEQRHKWAPVLALAGDVRQFLEFNNVKTIPDSWNFTHSQSGFDTSQFANLIWPYSGLSGGIPGDRSLFTRNISKLATQLFYRWLPAVKEGAVYAAVTGFYHQESPNRTMEDTGSVYGDGLELKPIRALGTERRWEANWKSGPGMNAFQYYLQSLAPNNSPAQAAFYENVGQFLNVHHHTTPRHWGPEDIHVPAMNIFQLSDSNPITAIYDYKEEHSNPSRILAFNTDKNPIDTAMEIGHSGGADKAGQPVPRALAFFTESLNKIWKRVEIQQFQQLHSFNQTNNKWSRLAGLNPISQIINQDLVHLYTNFVNSRDLVVSQFLKPELRGFFPGNPGIAGVPLGDSQKLVYHTTRGYGPGKVYDQSDASGQSGIHVSRDVYPVNLAYDQTGIDVQNGAHVVNKTYDQSSVSGSTGSDIQNDAYIVNRTYDQKSVTGQNRNDIPSSADTTNKSYDQNNPDGQHRVNVPNNAYSVNQTYDQNGRFGQNRNVLQNDADFGHRTHDQNSVSGHLQNDVPNDVDVIINGIDDQTPIQKGIDSQQDTYIANRIYSQSGMYNHNATNPRSGMYAENIIGDVSPAYRMNLIYNAGLWDNVSRTFGGEALKWYWEKRFSGPWPEAGFDWAAKQPRFENRLVSGSVTAALTYLHQFPLVMVYPAGRGLAQFIRSYDELRNGVATDISWMPGQRQPRLGKDRMCLAGGALQAVPFAAEDTARARKLIVLTNMDPWNDYSFLKSAGYFTRKIWGQVSKRTWYEAVTGSPDLLIAKSTPLQEEPAFLPEPDFVTEYQRNIPGSEVPLTRLLVDDWERVRKSSIPKNMSWWGEYPFLKSPGYFTQKIREQVSKRTWYEAVTGAFNLLHTKSTPLQEESAFLPEQDFVIEYQRNIPWREIPLTRLLKENQLRIVVAGIPPVVANDQIERKPPLEIKPETIAESVQFIASAAAVRQPGFPAMGRHITATGAEFIRSTLYFQKSLQTIQALAGLLANIPQKPKDLQESWAVAPELFAGPEAANLKWREATGEFRRVSRYEGPQGAGFPQGYNEMALEFQKPKKVASVNDEAYTRGEPEMPATCLNKETETTAGNIKPIELDIDQITEKVYYQIEKKLKFERQRMGM